MIVRVFVQMTDPKEIRELLLRHITAPVQWEASVQTVLSMGNVPDVWKDSKGPFLILGSRLFTLSLLLCFCVVYCLVLFAQV